MPLLRPRLLIETARIGATLYQRKRDLPAALAGTGAAGLPKAAILERLGAVERDCEEMRRTRSPAYRPGRHVQILAALLAEAGGDQAKASGSDALRVAT
ncbi:MAG TPA: DUF6477 family protein [Thermohalobaculum sp.]|nr:DUF6477 family protein [Thermohalobaculum sp.]